MWTYSDRYLYRDSNTQILFEVPKKPNTKYHRLLGINKIRIPNMNNSIRSHYSNSILMHNYLSHYVWQHIRYAFLIVFNVCKIKLLNLNIVYPHLGCPVYIMILIKLGSNIRYYLSWILFWSIWTTREFVCFPEWGLTAIEILPGP